MGVHPSYYRQADEIYPQDAIILTRGGTFPLQLEHYLGQAGADSISILNRIDAIKNNYDPFVRYQNKYQFVDYTKPRVNAFNDTFLLPSALGKKTLKRKNPNPLAPFISLIAGAVIFASLYMIVRDCRIISNSYKLIKKSENIRRFLDEAKNENVQVNQDPVYKSLYRVAELREKIYKRNLISASISVAITVSLIAVSIFAVAAAVVMAYPLLIAASVVGGALLLGHGVKAIVEWKGRLDIKPSRQILENIEALRVTLPPHLEQELNLDVPVDEKNWDLYARINVKPINSDVKESPNYLKPLQIDAYYEKMKQSQ